MNIDVMMTQPGTHEWVTPQELFDTLDKEFHFALDAAATRENAKCKQFYTREDDALNQPWWSRAPVWCNPPYGGGLAKWVKKGHDEAKRGAIIVMLIPSRTETVYWHDYVMKAAEIRFIKGRLHFGGDVRTGHNAPFPSAVVVFRPDCYGSPRLSAIRRTGTKL